MAGALNLDVETLKRVLWVGILILIAVVMESKWFHCRRLQDGFSDVVEKGKTRTLRIFLLPTTDDHPTQTTSPPFPLHSNDGDRP